MIYTSHNPKISVIMPVFNAERYVGSSIRSILLQTYKNLELIIVNDGSVDESEEIIRTFINRDNRVRYVKQENAGVAGARNAGLIASDGEWIAHIDSDDIATTDRLERSMEFANRTGEKCLVYGGYFNFNIGDGKMNIMEYIKNESESFDPFLFQQKNIISTSTVMHHRGCVETAGLFDEKLVVNEDWDLWLNISDDFNLYQMNEPLGFVRTSDAMKPKKKEKAQKILDECNGYITEKRIRRLLDIYDKKPQSEIAKKIFYASFNINETDLRKAVLDKLEPWRIFNTVIGLLKRSPKEAFELLEQNRNDELISHIMKDTIFDFPIPISNMTSKDFGYIKNVLQSLVSS